jgi:hypothetical protein
MLDRYPDGFTMDVGGSVRPIPSAARVERFLDQLFRLETGDQVMSIRREIPEWARIVALRLYNQIEAIGAQAMMDGQVNQDEAAERSSWVNAVSAIIAEEYRIAHPNRTD